MWKDNQALALELQNVMGKMSQMEDLYKSRNNDIDRERL